MCHPLAYAALAVTTTAASVVSEVKAAKRQNAVIEQQLTTAIKEVKEQEAAEINDRLREARREQGRIRVAAGEAGLQLGGSVAALLQDSTMQAALYEDRVKQNARHKTDALIAEANSAYSRVQQPTVFGAGLRIASAGVQGYLTGKNLQISREKAAIGG